MATMGPKHKYIYPVVLEDDNGGAGVIKGDVIHLINHATENSWCGRVKADGEVETASRKPAGADFRICGRCTQLSAGTGKAETPAELKARVGGNPSRVTKKVRPMIAAGQKRKVRSAPAADQGVTGSHYDSVGKFLTDNGVEVLGNVDATGEHITFSVNGWTYGVWASEYNANGAAAGWVISYNEEAADADDEYVDDDLPDADSVIAWLAKDLGFSVPAKPKGGYKAAAPSPRRTATIVTADTLVSIVTASRSVMDQARTIAEQIGELDQDTMDLIQTIITSQVNLAQILRK